MRALFAMGLAAATLLAGCQMAPSSEAKFSSPIFNNFSDVATAQDRDRPPYILSYPDETMFFFPIYDRPLRSDLNLKAIACRRSADGALIVSARIQNLGADLIPTQEQLYGDVSAFRVLARVTWSNGVRQDVYGSVPFPMDVSMVFNLDTKQTRYFAQDVTSIEVLVDPDQVVPDPIRVNNVLSWQGTMNPDSPSCDVVRS